MEKDIIGVALTKELCQVCCKEVDGPIVINQELTKESAEAIKKLDKKITGYSEKPCDECSEHMKKGIILIITDDFKTTEPANPWRTGDMFVVAHVDFIENKDFRLSVENKRAMFLDMHMARSLNLLSSNRIEELTTNQKPKEDGNK